MSGLREKIKSTNDIKKEILEIEEWDCSIEIRTMTAKQRAVILDKVMGDKGNMDHDLFHGYMITVSCFDPETGELIFQPDDAEWLMEKSSGPIERIMTSVMRLSGLNKSAIEEAEKN
jgi:hypothetical protein